MKHRTQSSTSGDNMPPANSPGQTGHTSTPVSFNPFQLTSDHLSGNNDFSAENENHLENHWSVPWADLMMVMFVLFATLVTVQSMREQEALKQAMQQAKVSKPEISTKPKSDPVLSRQPSFQPLMKINVFERSQQAVQDANLKNVEIVLLDDQSVKVSVQGPMFFEPGKADLRSEVKSFLENLAVIIRQTPYQVQVIGHTDDYPINTELFPSNWELSAVRASRVARYLIQKGEIDPARFTVMGRSKYQPAKPNADDTNRALNRRVEIIITREIAEPKIINKEIKR